MNSLQDRIYRKVIYYEDDVVQMEQLEAAVYEAALAAESGAFWLGVRYAPSLSGQL